MAFVTDQRASGPTESSRACCAGESAGTRLSPLSAALGTALGTRGGLAHARKLGQTAGVALEEVARGVPLTAVQVGAVTCSRGTAWKEPWQAATQPPPPEGLQAQTRRVLF